MRKTGRLKTVVITVAMFLVFAAAAAWIATEYGASRAITVIAAIGLVAALTWIILAVVSIITATKAHREVEDEGALRNEQRAVPRRAPIMPGEDDAKRVGRRRKTSE